MAHDWLDCLRTVELPRGRRRGPRLPAPGAFCTEISDEHERYSMVSDLSPTGLRLHRPSIGPQSRSVQVELDLPGVDELIWAKGVVCFDRVWRAGTGRVLHTTGIEIVRAAGRHLRLLRDYALEHAGRFGTYADRRLLAR
jgi:hypothetical protein